MAPRLLKNLYIIFGPPGSGKTNQAKRLAEHLSLKSISWGSIYRNAKSDFAYGDSIKIINRKSTSNTTRSTEIAGIIEDEINKLSVDNSGLIVEGFPRRVEESKLLMGLCNKYNFKIKSLIRINPSFETTYKRIGDRAYCYKCKYYFEDGDLSLAGKPQYCPKDGSKLSRIITSEVEAKREFYTYIRENEDAFNYLKKFSETFFDVSGDDDELLIFSNILMKIKYKTKYNNKIFEKKASVLVETEYGVFKLIAYQSKIDFSYHLALVKGSIKDQENVLMRIHSSCITGDIFGSYRCDCAAQLHESLVKINKEGRGILLYLFQEGRGINIINKLRTYRLQRSGFDTVEANEMLGLPAEMRDYGVVKDILSDLKVRSIRVLTNNPDKIGKLTDLGIIVAEMVALEISPGEYNKKYLLTKKEKMGHKLHCV